MRREKRRYKRSDKGTLTFRALDGTDTMNWEPNWKLESIPDELFNSEIGRRRAASGAGRPKLKNIPRDRRKILDKKAERMRIWRAGRKVS
jgi:hypothetical protein